VCLCEVLGPSPRGPILCHGLQVLDLDLFVKGHGRIARPPLSRREASLSQTGLLRTLYGRARLGLAKCLDALCQGWLRLRDVTVVPQSTPSASHRCVAVATSGRRFVLLEQVLVAVIAHGKIRLEQVLIARTSCGDRTSWLAANLLPIRGEDAPRSVDTVPTACLAV
jgi:hypothetical protein